MKKSYDLSILIPARNEMFLARTVEDLLENKRGNTEVIVGLDGEWANPPVIQHEDVTVFYCNKSIGQRAMTNQLCRLSEAKYVMKIDAHCSVDEGFDIKMMSEMKDDYTMAPLMKNLHVFDWKCNVCGSTWYQGRTPIECLIRTGKEGKETIKNPNCDNKTDFERVMVWKPNKSPNSTAYRFDKTLHFQYWKELTKRPEIVAQGDISDTMSFQGSCFMLTRDKYWELDICDEGHGSWGQQGTEIACKTWLSGGRLVTNRKTWYAHLFRTQGGDFGFPYPNPGIDKAREYSKGLWFSSLEDLKKRWKPAIYDLNWLLKKFAPIPDWDASVGVLYYSDGKLDKEILEKCQNQIKKSIGDKELVSCTLVPMKMGKNVILDLERGYLTMAMQILEGLRNMKSDIVFFTEHDVYYHPSHFLFTPTEKNKFYYNTNVWRVRKEDGHAIRTEDCRQLSGLCAYRDTLIAHFEKRVEMLKEAKEIMNGEEFNRYVRKMGFEPGTHGREEKVDDLKSERWESEYPNIDIRHNSNLTPSRWNKDQFVNKKYTEGWEETDIIPGWGNFKEIF